MLTSSALRVGVKWTGRRWFSAASALHQDLPGHRVYFIERIPPTKESVSQRLAVSFLPQDALAKVTAEKAQKVIVGWVSKPSAVISPDDFLENKPFVDFLHSVIEDRVGKLDDPALKAFAEWQGQGWMHIADERNPAPWGRIPLPEDIFGSILLKEGKIQDGTYQRNPTHRIVSQNGLFQLSEPLLNELVKACQGIVDAS
ncbi:hypothetical protein BZG36_02046 [Bifiguratus adelaidae]|uniref:Uncharacterized protein n=1 Tax=Bifiguratus adelaidae TaxID=1938954 RepID=A0A261Y215_9FUNG|nr:hypothetical protein BZG36_02046 [Bifiguratus adelaidae]